MATTMAKKASLVYEIGGNDGSHEHSDERRIPDILTTHPQAIIMHSHKSSILQHISMAYHLCFQGMDLAQKVYLSRAFF